MTGIEDRPTLAERYSRAMESSHLEVKPERGDVDFLIAAGWTGESLGTDLYRTRMEFDGLNKRELAQADTSLIARVMALAQMGSLGQTKQTLGRFAMAHATRAKFNGSAESVMAITGVALDVWLDPNCHHCTGRGFTGGFTSPMAWCSPCQHTGNRRVRLAKSEDAHQFGRSLLNEMDRKCNRVTGLMKRFLAQGE